MDQWLISAPSSTVRSTLPSLWLAIGCPPKRQLSMPRLELCAALTSAQLAQFFKQDLTITIETVTLWTDSTTVLTRIQSESCRYKVFVGTRVAEIQVLTELHSWRYVDSSNNPADSITRGGTLMELANSDMWRPRIPPRTTRPMASQAACRGPRGYLRDKESRLL